MTSKNKANYDKKVVFLTKEKECLDCGTRKVTLKYNPNSKIYEGLRTCKVCLMSFKRKYLR